MGWTTKQIVLSIVLVFTGSINTISTKWANLMQSPGSDGKVRPFDHPFFQASCMFFGEFLCLISFKIVYHWLKRKENGSENENDLVKGNRDFNPFIFLPPAMCDMIATSLMYVGLNLTYASSFQMLRGAVIVFVALLSMLFLGRKITLKMWFGIFLTLAGLIVVGLSDFASSSSDPSTDTTKEIIGDIIIVGAQIIVAIQMVVEEKFVTGKDIPALQAVGWEGIFGFVVLSLLMIPFYFIHTSFSHNAHGVLEDFPDAMSQIYNHVLLLVALSGTIISIAFFNFAGISVTKEMSATTRMILDSVRILFIYLFSLCVSWQEFHSLQILGFVLLIFGMAIYNDLIPSISQLLQCCKRTTQEAALIPTEVA